MDKKEGIVSLRKRLSDISFNMDAMRFCAARRRSTLR